MQITTTKMHGKKTKSRHGRNPKQKLKKTIGGVPLVCIHELPTDARTKNNYQNARQKTKSRHERNPKQKLKKNNGGLPLFCIHASLPFGEGACAPVSDLLTRSYLQPGKGAVTKDTATKSMVTKGMVAVRTSSQAITQYTVTKGMAHSSTAKGSVAMSCLQPGNHTVHGN